MFCKIVCGHRVSDLMMEALIVVIMQRAPAPFMHMFIVYGPLWAPALPTADILLVLA